MEEGLFIFFYIIAPVVFLCFYFIKIIPARRAAIVERLGLFNRVLYPGFHVILRPFETLKEFNWSYRGQDGRLRFLKATQISFDDCQLDIPPLECYTEDQIKVSFDGVLYYRIIDFQKVAYGTDDVLNLLYQLANQAIRHVLSQKKSPQLQGFDNEIGSQITQYVNEQLKDRGIACIKFLVQNTKIDAKISEAYQSIFASRREQEMLADKEEKTHERTMANLKRKKEEQLMEADLKLSEAETRRKVASLQLNAKYPGFTIDQILRAKEIESMKSPNKVVYAPLRYWESNIPSLRRHEEGIE